MKRKKNIGLVLVIIGLIIIEIKDFFKIDQISEFLDVVRIFGAAAFVFVGCYLLYQAKKAQRDKEKQP